MQVLFLNLTLQELNSTGGLKEVRAVVGFGCSVPTQSQTPQKVVIVIPTADLSLVRNTSTKIQTLTNLGLKKNLFYCR